MLAASGPALKPFFRRFLVEPITSAVDSSKRNKSAAGNTYGYGGSDRKGWSLKSSTNRGSAMLIDDPENIGVAYGGTEVVKSREESFVKEVCDEDAETRKFELRYSREGRIVPMQVWRSKKSEDRERSSGVVRMDSNGHVRNFSQPNTGNGSYSSNGDGTTQLVKSGVPR